VPTQHGCLPVTPAEHLDPAAFGSVTISAQRWEQTRVMTRTLTAQADISRLTAIINAGTPASARGARGRTLPNVLADMEGSCDTWSPALPWIASAGSSTA